MELLETSPRVRTATKKMRNDEALTGMMRHPSSQKRKSITNQALNIDVFLQV
jgi:hypothetical protein